MIIMEYAPHGNLLDYLRKKKSLMNEESGDHHSNSGSRNCENMLENRQLVLFAMQIAKGMDHLAKMKVKSCFGLTFD